MVQFGKEFFGALLVPRGVLAWLARLLLFCGTAFFVHVGLKSMAGLPVHYGIDFLLVSGTVAPLLGLAMMATRLQEDSIDKLNREIQLDGLTGLLNRRGFSTEVAIAGEGALLMIDIDHFKHVNDRYGHAVGDEVLRAMAQHLKSHTRDGDLVGRLGGEEFAVFLANTDSFEIDHIGERLCRGFVLYNEKVPSPVKITMSVGAAFSQMASTRTAMFQHADMALYQAKRSGRARLNFWQPQVSARY